MSEHALQALAQADAVPYWIEHTPPPDRNETLIRDEHCDLCVIGGGYTGLWTAILAKERNPQRDVVLLEQDGIGSGASGKNGGFMDASLTHGVANGQERFPKELATLESMGLATLNAIESTIRTYQIDCDYERTGVIDVATAPHHVEELAEDYEHLRALGQNVTLLDEAGMRGEVNSPTYLGGLWRKGRAAIVDPARLNYGLKRVAETLGVRIFEDSTATSLTTSSSEVIVHSDYANVHAAKVALGTNAFPPLLRRLRHYMVPVYDYVLATEPLTPSQLHDIGWERRQGLTDWNNQFHYYRLTADNRILWGGYDAIYYFNGKVNPDLEWRAETFRRLSEHFFTTFPALEGVSFTHAWGGAIDTCSRFAPFFGTARNGRVAYAIGYTGLGVVATRFGAEVMLDLLDGSNTIRTRLDFVKKKPLPFPPEPLRWGGIQLTRWSLDRADRRNGKRNLWLRLLDRLGLGFDS